MAVLLRVLRMFLTVIVLRPGLVPIRPLALIVIVTRPDLAPIRPFAWAELMELLVLGMFLQPRLIVPGLSLVTARPLTRVWRKLGSPLAPPLLLLLSH